MKIVKKLLKYLFIFSLFTLHCSLFTAFVHAQTTSTLESTLATAWATQSAVPVAVSPNGKFLAKSYSVYKISKSDKMAIQLFDLRSFRPIRFFENAYVVDNMIFSPDSKKLITSSTHKNTVTVWNVETGEKLKEFDAGHASHSIDISADGKFLLIGGGWNSSTPTVIDMGNFNTVLTINAGRYAVARFASGGSRILTAGGQEGAKSMIMWDAHNGQRLDEYMLPQLYYKNNCLSVSPEGNYFTISGYSETYYGKIDNNKMVYLKTVYSFSRDFIYDALTDNAFLIDDFSLSTYSLKTAEKVNSFQFKEVAGGGMIFKSEKQKLANIASVNKGNHLIITDNRNVSYIYSVKENKIQAFLYTYGDKDYVVVTPDGRMEGTVGAIEKLQWRQGKNTIPLSNTYEQMYTPNLLAQIFEGVLEESTVSIDNVVNFTPGISFISPKTGLKVTTPTLKIEVGTTVNGEEIKQIRIFVNDKLVNEDVRGFKEVGSALTYELTLLPGKNSIKAIAISKSGYQSSPAEIQVEYTGATSESKLYVLAIGINQYKNSNYNLNYAVADAQSFADKMKLAGADIFKTQEIIIITDVDATREKIQAAFDKLSLAVQPQDAFIMFYAGHGVMSDGTAEIQKDFFLALYNVTQLYSKDEMLKANGLSATELREYCKNIRAQKQVILLDACQSGGAVETFASRGAAEEKAILQLARATGSVLIASTGTEQFATEFSSLGHGVFTYALLEGLGGKADGGDKDKKITIKELEAFLNDFIPQLTEKYHGSAQYPKTWSLGMDFPLGITK